MFICLNFSKIKFITGYSLKFQELLTKVLRDKRSTNIINQYNFPSLKIIYVEILFPYVNQRNYLKKCLSKTRALDNILSNLNDTKQNQSVSQ